MRWAGTDRLIDATGFNLASVSRRRFYHNKFEEVEIPDWASAQLRETILSTMVAMDWSLRVEPAKAAKRTNKMLGANAALAARIKAILNEHDKEAEKEREEERERELEKESGWHYL